jgi:hypothetical protein
MRMVGAGADGRVGSGGHSMLPQLDQDAEGSSSDSDGEMAPLRHAAPLSADEILAKLAPVH